MEFPLSLTPRGHGPVEFPLALTDSESCGVPLSLTRFGNQDKTRQTCQSQAKHALRDFGQDKHAHATSCHRKLSCFFLFILWEPTWHQLGKHNKVHFSFSRMLRRRVPVLKLGSGGVVLAKRPRSVRKREFCWNVKHSSLVGTHCCMCRRMHRLSQEPTLWPRLKRRLPSLKGVTGQKPQQSGEAKSEPQWWFRKPFRKARSLTW